jgi:tetratricopeptide (TPR) repeat protein
VQFVAIPSVGAAADYVHGNYAKVIDETDGALVYARSNTGLLYLRGCVYLKQKQPSDAVQAFQKIIDLRNFSFFDPMLSLAQLGLGRAYAIAGDDVKSRTAYQDFFAAWKDADPDIALLRQAKAEYAKLQ